MNYYNFNQMQAYAPPAYAPPQLNSFMGPVPFAPPFQQQPQLPASSLYSQSSSISQTAHLLHKQHSPLALKPVQFRSANVAPIHSANIRWSSGEAVNFMEHLYFLTNLVLEYLLDSELPRELMNQTLIHDPIPVFMDNKNVLIAHFHKLLLAACICLCIGISIPLFGFMIACCWCSGGSSKAPPKRSHSASRRRVHSNTRTRHRDSGWPPDSHSRYRDPSSVDWSSNPSSARPSARFHRERRRHGPGHRRSSGSIDQQYRSRSVPPSLSFESACHPCLRTIFSSNMFITLLLISFFVVCAFVTNEYINNGVKQFPKTVDQSLDELQHYFNNTNHQVDNLFRVNYQQLEDELSSRLNQSGLIISHKLAVASEAIAITNLTDIVTELSDTKIKFEKFERDLSSLKNQIRTAKKALDEIKLKVNKACPHAMSCPILHRKYPDLDRALLISLAVELMPEVKQITTKLDGLLKNGIVRHVSEGKEKFSKYSSLIQRDVGIVIPEVKSQLAVAGKRLARLAKDVSDSIKLSDMALADVKVNAHAKLDQLIHYEQYRRYAFLGGASIILFILLCYTFGWLYGTCRPQPTLRTYKTRAKTSATASFPFSCGIITMFLVFFPIVLAAIVLFMSGSIGDKVVCRVIEHPEQRQSKQIYAMLQNKFLAANLSVSDPDVDKVTIEYSGDGKELRVYRPNFADLIARCHRNQSLTKVLKLDEYDKVYLVSDARTAKTSSIELDKSFNIKSWTEFKKWINIEPKLKDLANRLQFDWKNIILLSKTAEELLMSSTSMSFNDMENPFLRFYDDAANILPIDVEQFAKDIHAQRESMPQDQDDLSLAQMLLEVYTSKYLPNITSSLSALKDGFRHMKLRTVYGKNSFGTVIKDLIAQTRSAERRLQENGPDLLTGAIRDYVEELDSLIQQYASHAKTQVESVIGQCEPVSRALNATTSAICDEIVLPFNGCWLSIMASLILILIASFFAYALKGLYTLVRRTSSGLQPGHHHSHLRHYVEQDDELSYDDDGEEVALAYLDHQPKSSSSAALPSAPLPVDDGWSPTSPSYIHNSRPPPYAV